MVLTDRQRNDLHAGMYEYLLSRPGEAFQMAAKALEAADPEACARSKENGNSNSRSHKTPLLEKKWTAIPRLQKKVLEMERAAAQNAKIYAHRSGGAGGVSLDGGGANGRRMLPRLPSTLTLKGHQQVVTSVVVHPVFTVVVSGSEDGTIKVWDHESGEYIRTLKGHTNTVNSVAFSPTGTHLISCSTDLSIKLWDFDTFNCVRTLRGHDHTISAVVFLPSPGLSSAESPSKKTNGIDAATAGSSYILSASRDHTVKMWDVETGFCDQTYSHHTDWVRCLAVRQASQAGGGNLWASAGNDNTIIVYEQSNLNRNSSSNKIVELRGHDHVVESVAFTTEQPLKAASSGRPTKHAEIVRDYLASGSRDRTVKLWKVSEGACIATFSSHENWVRSVIIHPSGNYVISSSDDRSIRVFDIKANRCLRTLENAHDHFVTSICMHYQLPILVSGSVDQTLKCWKLE